MTAIRVPFDSYRPGVAIACALVAMHCTAGVSGNGPEQVCAHITCSDHGHCVDNDGEPGCVCDTGYQAEGLTCVLTAPPCQDVDGDGYGVDCALGPDCDDTDDAVWRACSGFGFDAGVYSVGEADGTLTVTVIRTSTVGAASVGCSTRQLQPQGGGTGHAADADFGEGADYDGKYEALVFIDGQSNATFVVSIIDDANYTGDLTFELYLLDAGSENPLSPPEEAVVTIVDDEPPPANTPGTLQWDAANLLIGEAAGTVGLSVNRIGGTSGAVGIDYASSDDSASAGVDYQSTSGTLSWADGDATSKSVSLQLIDNAFEDGNRQLLVTLSNPQGGATLGVISDLAITIVDDEAASFVVNTVTGTVSAGEQITVSGNGFGTKAQAAPWVWDDFENGTEGALLETSATVAWSQYTGGPGNLPTYAAEGAYAGNLGAAKVAAYGPNWHNYGVKGLDSDVMYLSWYFRWTIDAGALSGGLIMKNTRANSTPDYYTGRPSLWVTMYANGGVYSNYVACDGIDGVQLNNLTTHAPGEWHRWEVYWKLSTPGSTDGFVRYFHNNVEVGVGHFADVTTRALECADKKIDNFMLPMMHDERATTAQITYRADNVYVDRTLARVELADSTTWSTRTHAEVQIPSQWSDGSITLTVNQGRFSPGQTVYLYVLDDNGEPMNASGFAVTFAP